MDKDAIVDQLRSYLNRSVSLKQLEGWVLLNLQAVLDSGNQESIEVLDELDVMLMRMADGELSEIEFFWRVNGLVSSSNTFNIAFPSFVITKSESSAPVVTSPGQDQIVLSFG